MPTQRQRFEALLEKHEPALRRAFLAGIDELKDGAVIREVAEALEAGDVEGALNAMRIEPEAFRELEQAYEAAFEDGGVDAADLITGTRTPNAGPLFIRFNVRNPRAENFVRDHSSTLVTRITDDQRTTIRNTMNEGLQRGRNPRTTALDIVGRIDPATQRRTGGVIGLSAPQGRAVNRARDELASGDPAQLRNYLTRAARDKRFDIVVNRALRDGTPIPADQAQRAIQRYSDRLLRLRGETIARTETLSAIQSSKLEAFQQAVDSGQVSANAVRKTWNSAGDFRVRHTHTVLDGDTVGLNEQFISPSGALLSHPGDGPPEESINCRCDMSIRIDFFANVR